MMQTRYNKGMSSVIKQAEDYCTTHGFRFTEPRRFVLSIILDSKKPVGAYDILEKRNGAKPPTIYRALEFWQEQNFIHRIESLNAYIPCKCDHHHSGAQVLVCDTCGMVIETHLCTIPDELQERVNEKGFISQSWNVEIHGQCAKCTQR